MSNICGKKRVSAIIPLNKDCVTFMFKDGTNTTFTYLELRESWNEINGFNEAGDVPNRKEKTPLSESPMSEQPTIVVREPVAHGKYPKLHPLATPRTISYES